MIKPLLLDSGPLGRIAHPKPDVEFSNWFKDLLSSGAVVMHPEIADYEVRRSLLRAAELWAKARNRGRLPADPKELNGDVILAAQALEAGGIVLTDNVGHLAQFIEARTWKEYQP